MQENMASRLSFFLVLAALVTVFAVRDKFYYDALGVSHDASDREIRKAFKKKALIHHPDKNRNDPKAHDLFLELNLAYEILKDPATRKQYDRMGKQGLKDHQSRGGGQQYEDWNFYQQEFGLYDEDEQIETLNSETFSQMHRGDEIWIVNFYSPRCSHCHDLAPDWREVGTTLRYSVGVGAVNCKDSYDICQQMGIQGYPTILRFSKGESVEKFNGRRAKQGLIDFALASFPKPEPVTFVKETNQVDLSNIGHQSLVVVVCDDEESYHCDNDLELLKLAAYLYGSAKVATLDCLTASTWCNDNDITSTHARLYLRPNTSSGEHDNNDSATNNGIRIFPHDDQDWESDYSLLVVGQAVVSQLTLPQQIDAQTFRNAVIDGALLPHIRGTYADVHWELISSTASCTGNWEGIERMSVEQTHTLQSCQHKCIAHRMCTGVDYHTESHECNLYTETCERPMAVDWGPSSWNLLRGTGVASWLVFFISDDGDCDECKEVFEAMRRVNSEPSTRIKPLIVRCDTESELCREDLAITKLPFVSLFKAIGREDYHGKMGASYITSWAKHSTLTDVISFTDTDFPTSIEEGQLLFVDFFAPWCEPCRAMLPHFRDASVILENVQFRTIDCERFPAKCEEFDVQSYPNPMLFNSSMESRHTFTGDFNDVNSYVEFVKDILDPPMMELSPSIWDTTIMNSTQVWVLIFTAGSWCGPCQHAMAELKEAAKHLRGVVQFSYVDCDKHRDYCQNSHHIHRYPVTKRYRDVKGWSDLHSGMVWTDRVVQWVSEWLPNKVKKMTSVDIDSLVLATTHPWVIVFSCPRWCRPCVVWKGTQKMVALLMTGDNVKFGHIDCDDYRDYCNKHHVHSYPTIRLYNGVQGTLPLSSGAAVADIVQTVRAALPSSSKADNALLLSLSTFYNTLADFQGNVEEVTGELARKYTGKHDELFNKLELKYGRRPQLVGHDEL